MKTKFIRAPEGEENKHIRERLRTLGRNYLLARQNQIEQTKFEKLSLWRVFVLPDEGERGYLSCAFNDSESLRFYLSPGEYLGAYIADKIEFVYQDGQEQIVSFDVSKEPWAQTLFECIDDKDPVARNVANAQTVVGYKDIDGYGLHTEAN